MAVAGHESMVVLTLTVFVLFGFAFPPVISQQLAGPCYTKCSTDLASCIVGCDRDRGCIMQCISTSFECMPRCGPAPTPPTLSPPLMGKRS
ncbi:hypothetical protein ACHQM5_028693 [Ranunculus cassubicifolius]